MLTYETWDAPAIDFNEDDETKGALRFYDGRMIIMETMLSMHAALV